MELQTSESKKLFKVFDASKRKRTRKKNSLDDCNSAATDESNGAGCRISSGKASLQDMSAPQCGDAPPDVRDRGSSPSIADARRTAHRSPRRHRRPMDGISLALKAGLVSTPRSITPPQDVDGIESVPRDQDSFIYAFLEDAIKRDKKKNRHARRHEDRRRDQEQSVSRDHRHHRHRQVDDLPSREVEIPSKDVTPLNQADIFETFAKLCAQLNDKAHGAQMERTLSHKSLQVEVEPRRDTYDDQHPVKLRTHEQSRENISSSRVRSMENFYDRVRSQVNVPRNNRPPGEYCKEKFPNYSPYDKENQKYSSKVNVVPSKMRNIGDERYRGEDREYTPDAVPTRSFIDYRAGNHDMREYRHYLDHRDSRRYEDSRRRCAPETHRSYDTHRGYVEDDRVCRRTSRSDTIKERRYDDRDKRYDDRYIRDSRYDDRDRRDRYYEEKPVAAGRHSTVFCSKERQRKERYDRHSSVSRDDDYRDRYSEKEKDSGLSVADGETSINSEKSNYLRVVKQEITEQREAMDKMMKLWKELMRCFKTVQNQAAPGQEKAVHESAENVRESAAAQLRLWRECMRRYETVARDVGDTDARLMEEITKQRSEMAEMTNMWQECLQRYRDMSNDFNNLKQKLTVSPENPTRLPAPGAPPACAEGEASAAPAPYRLPNHYPPPPADHYPTPMPAPLVYPCQPGSPLRSRASAPPAWWWGGERPPPAPRRRSSPDSRGSRERHRRHKDEPTRYKEKSKSAARSDHKHRKR